MFKVRHAEDTVNNVAVSQNGRKIAVSTYNSSSGVFNSLPFCLYTFFKCL